MKYVPKKTGINLEKAISTIRPIWLSIDTSLSDPQIKEIVYRRAIGTVLNSSGSCIGIVRAEEISNFFDIYNLEIYQKDSKQMHEDFSYIETPKLGKHEEAIKCYDKILSRHGVRVLVLGMDGYIGWGLAMHLAKRGHIVSGVDNFARRVNVESVGSQSAIPLLDMQERVSAFKKIHGENLSFFEGDTGNCRNNVERSVQA